MNIIKTNIEGVLILEPKVYGDSRGYFMETWSYRDFLPIIGDVHFVQDNQSRSSRGVIRGLHFQKPPYSQAKLVRVVEGAVLDVAVDLRKGSPTYGKYTAVELTEENKRQLFIPRGFAHGFTVLSDFAAFTYKCDNYFEPASEGGIAYDDPDINIDWRLDGVEPILSERDKAHPRLKDFQSPF